MTQRALFDIGRATGAVFSDCRTWRYSLWRTWHPALPAIAFIGLNPSTADETNDDPTIRRCIQFAKDWGYGTYVMLNIFAFRSTDPKGLRSCIDPVGPDNNAFIAEAVKQVQMVCVAWGAHKHPQIDDRVQHVAGLIENAHCLGTTKDGHPRHPLYVPGATTLARWEQKTEH